LRRGKLMLAALGPLLRNWRLIGVGLLLLAIGVQTFRLNLSERTVERQRLEHRLFAARVEAKANQIRADFLAYKALVEGRQTQITQEVSREYQERLAALRADYERRLRDSAGPGDRPVGPAPGVSPLPGAPGRPDGPAAPVEEFACEANTLQLEFLQRWVREQAGNREAR
jgi:hypothetical protein